MDQKDMPINRVESGGRFGSMSGWGFVENHHRRRRLAGNLVQVQCHGLVSLRRLKDRLVGLISAETDEFRNKLVAVRIFLNFAEGQAIFVSPILRERVSCFKKWGCPPASMGGYAL